MKSDRENVRCFASWQTSGVLDGMWLPTQARGRWKNDCYSDDDEPAAPKAIPLKAAANGVAKGAGSKAVANGRPAGKAAKDPVALRRQRLLADEAEVRPICYMTCRCVGQNNSYEAFSEEATVRPLVQTITQARTCLISSHVNRSGQRSPA